MYTYPVLQCKVVDYNKVGAKLDCGFGAEHTVIVRLAEIPKSRMVTEQQGVATKWLRRNRAYLVAVLPVADFGSEELDGDFAIADTPAATLTGHLADEGFANKLKKRRDAMATSRLNTLSVEDAAKRLKLAERTVRGYCKTKEGFAEYKNGAWHIYPEVVAKLLENPQPTVGRPKKL